MIDPKKLHILIGIIFSALTGVATIASLVEPVPTWLTSLSQNKSTINSFAFVTILVTALFVPFYILNRKLFSERAKHQTTKQFLAVTERQLHLSERDRRLDVITGIPNQKQFREDIAKISGLVSSMTPYQIIFFDLIEFGNVNKDFGYDKGDEVIEYFATSVSDGMRRDEDIYKLPIKALESDSDLWRRAYRKYTGGDEFLVVLSGSEPDAIGYLNRLQRRIIKEFDPHVQESILKSDKWRIRFNAAIVEIKRNDSEEDVLDRVQQGMWKASHANVGCRVYWSSRKKPSDFPENSWQARAYEEALQLFSTDQNNS